MDETTPLASGLTPSQIELFITDGFVRIAEAFPRALADEARAILWRATRCSPDDPTTWTEPVIRLSMFTKAPFVDAANTARLQAAFDQLVGPGLWRRPEAMAPSQYAFRQPSIPVTPDGTSTRASKGRALLMLFLFSDVAERDAPTLIRVGSHADIARQLAPAGEQGLTLGELAADDFAASAHRAVVPATGDAGTVYLCHPFLVHAAQPHQGERPRFLAQPPLLPLDPDRRGRGELSPVDQAVARALGGRP